mgnify:CR=1 FL=1
MALPLLYSSRLLHPAPPPETRPRPIDLALLPLPHVEHTPLQLETVSYAAQFEQRLQEGAKAIFHLEAFVARVMSNVKTYLVSCGLA